MPLEKIAHQTLSDAVFEQLAAEIVWGSMAPGVSLPAERELVTKLGVNRGAVREALKRLAQAGLVRIQQGGGTRVLDFRRTAGLDFLGRLLLRPDGEIDLKVARSIVEMRAVLAPDIAKLCARRAGPATAARLYEFVAAMKRAEDSLDELQVISLSFWEELVRGADSVAYELAFNSLKETYALIREALMQVMADELRDAESCRKLADAVAKRDDVAAERCARTLIAKGTRRMSVLIAMLEPGDERTEGGGET